ncbi:hypothetical protein DID88_008065 [Monilinia fructigena]|uniref:Uncharacterized protein n=1 Tax=Monilinia fructigena TaxID=38457 RepID=A0A395J484_9HELO|nr:hypothetical protein DID88_008065 [Monilinia fructigena]
MGLPYSKQIHTAFSQSQIMMARLQTEVTPLVAAGYPLIASTFAVLKTTKNIAVLLACVQVYTAVMLTAHLVVLGMVLVAVDPDLEEERRRFVSPVLRRIVEFGARWGVWLGWGVKAFVVGVVAGAGVAVWWGIVVEEKEEKERVMEEEGDGDGVGQGDEEMEDDDETAIVEE